MAELAMRLSDEELAKRGVRYVDLRSAIDPARWVAVARQVSPLLAAQDEGDAPHANDLLEEPGFPFAEIVAAARSTLREYVDDPEDLELYDAFSLYYDEKQVDTTFNQHRDPSHVTVNVCLHSDCEGSNVEFFGTADAPSDESFAVTMREGHAVVHYGRHLHQTTPLRRGTRAQAVLYYKRRGVVGDNDATYHSYVGERPDAHQPSSGE